MSVRPISSVRPIVLVEDNAKVRRLYAELLQSAGYKVMCAVDGEKAVALMHKIASPLLIVLDVMMPKLDGIEACKRIRRIQGLRSCPILFLTALDTPKTMLECLKAGGDDFIMKSQPVQTVLERVNVWARRGDSEENLPRRQHAIRELEAMLTRSEAERKRLDETADAEAEPTLKKLVSFVTNRREVFVDDDPLHRFGYLVGLFEAYAPRTIHDKQAFHFFLKKLIFKTVFIDPRDTEALLDNFQRVVKQAQFQQGRSTGRDEAPLVDAWAATEAPA